MTYELWELSSGNAIAEFETEVAALEVVRRMVQKHGRDGAATWSLVTVEGDDDTLIADGDALIDRALGQTAAAAEGT